MTRREPPWRRKRENLMTEPSFEHPTNAWTGVSGTFHEPVVSEGTFNRPDVVLEPPKTPPWRTLREVAADTGARVVYHEGTKVQVKVPIGRRYPPQTGYPRWPKGETIYNGVVDPELVSRFITEEEHILMLVEAEVENRFQLQLDKLKKRVEELENLFKSQDMHSSFFSGDW